eukprot:7051734-Pyramimonas_sp.AAC.1
MSKLLTVPIRLSYGNRSETNISIHSQRRALARAQPARAPKRAAPEGSAASAAAGAPPLQKAKGPPPAKAAGGQPQTERPKKQRKARN